MSVLDVFKKKEVAIIWQPQKGTQEALIACPVFEVFFGGARGGGKTESSIGDWLAHSSTYGESAIGLFVRKSFVQLQEVIARTKQIFPKLGARYNEKDHLWTMANGARLKFAYLENDKDAEQYQGHSYTRVYVEEVTNFASPDPINKLRATLRSAAGVPCGMRLTGNPGGPGHLWVKSRYIDPYPAGFKIIEDVEEVDLGDGETIEVRLERVFIPSKLLDNQLLLRNDPGYVIRLRQSGSEALVRAWLKGDWNIVDGAFFDCFNAEVHVLGREWLDAIPRNAMRFRSFDWGSAKPFSVGWYVVSDGKWGIPKNALVKYQEWYGASGINKGLKMSAAMVAKGIVKREKGQIIQHGVADPSIFVRDGGPSIAETMSEHEVNFHRADNKRLPGWEQMRVRLVGEFDVPMLYFLENCVDSIRTIPVLQHDSKNSEDVDSEMEDHAADETRYAVMSRPWLPTHNKNDYRAEKSNVLDMTINEIIAMRRKARLEAMNEY